MTTQDTLRVIREIRQQLRNLGTTLDGRLIEETPAADDCLNVAREHILDAVAELDLAMEKIQRVGAVTFYQEVMKRPDIHNIMKGLAE